jgi:hypothetical protein
MASRPTTTKRFIAEIYEGHSDCAVIVPFDPAVAWGSATSARRIGYGKHVGHAVLGTINGESFESWIWFYFKQWRMVVAAEVLKAAGVAPGDTGKIAVRAHPQPESVAKYKPGPRRR